MKSTRMFIVAGLAFLSPVQQGLTEPNSTVQKLMGQPVNLFTYGLVRLGDTLTDEAKNGDFSEGTNLSLGATVFVEGDSHITINISGSPDPKDAPPDLEKLCAIVIQNVRSKAQINTETGKSDSSTFSEFARQFFPPPYGIPNEELQELDAIMSIAVVLYTKHFTKTIRCMAPLLGTGYEVEK